MKKITDLHTALELFIDAALKHGEATETGDYRAANLCYGDIVIAVSFIKENDNMMALEDLLHHESVGVRLWSASYLLPIVEDKAVDALKAISNVSAIHSFTAKTTLSEWEKKAKSND
jgi:hypothetical protein